MRKTTRYWFILSIILCVIGISFTSGYFMGKTDCTSKTASYHAIIGVGLLYRLYSGDTNEAIHNLEIILDQDTYAMALARKRLLAPTTRNQLEQAVHKVIVFRQRYPRHPLAMLRLDQQKTDAEGWGNIVQKHNTFAQKLNAEVDRLLSERKTPREAADIKPIVP